MTPTREQLEAIGAHAERLHWAAKYHAQKAPIAPVDPSLTDLWVHYFALGEALRQTGTEPPQPAEEV